MPSDQSHLQENMTDNESSNREFENYFLEKMLDKYTFSGENASKKAFFKFNNILIKTKYYLACFPYVSKKHVNVCETDSI